MRKKFDIQLKELHEDLVVMAASAETAISRTVEALKNKDADLARKVIENDSNIDELEKTIESKCLRILLQQQPVAADLRNVSAALKMVTDLERIGDQAADIAEITTYLCDSENVVIPESLPEMAREVILMVRNAVDAFVEGNVEKAQDVIEYDDVVDRDFVSARDELIEVLQKTPENGQQVMDLLMIAKYFERIGDHAANTAEWVVFSVTGNHKNTSVI